jgi:EAL domain-containing protein (putative c-di-GMP-specific phosphodiesterase class I)
MSILISLKSLSNVLWFSLIAEGIEDEAQSKYFTDLGITLQQGYYQGKPL